MNAKTKFILSRRLSPFQLGGLGLVSWVALLGSLQAQTDITISTGSATGSMVFGGGQFTDNATSPSNLNTTTLVNQLGSSNVEVTTTSGLGANGNITVNNGFTWNSANSLFLTADQDIFVNSGAAITGTNASADLTFTALSGDILVGEVVNLSGGLFTANGQSINLNAAVNAGAVDLTGLSVTLGDTITVTNSLSVSGPITLTNNVELDGASILVGNINLGGNTLTLDGSTSVSTGAITNGNLVTQTAATVASVNVTDATIGGGALTVMNALTVGGNLTSTANIAAASVSVTGTSLLGGNVTTFGNQTYIGTTTLTANVELDGAALSAGSINAGGNTLTLDGSTSVSTGAITNGNLVTQTAATVASVNVTDATIGGGALTVMNALTVGGNLTNTADIAAASVSVTGTSLLGGNVTTFGAQTYTGNVTLDSDVALTGSSVGFSANLIGSGNDLTLNAPIIMGSNTLNSGSAAGIGTFTAGGAVEAEGATTFATNHVYLGAVTLTDNWDLTGTTVEFQGAVDAQTAGVENLTINAPGGAVTVGAAVGENAALNNFSLTASSATMNAAVTATAATGTASTLTTAGPASLNGSNNELNTQGVAFSGVTTLVSTDGNLAGSGSDETFALTGANAGSVNSISFNGISNISGGGGVNEVQGTSSNDTFTLSSTGTFTANGITFTQIDQVDAQSGNDTLNISSTGVIILDEVFAGFEQASLDGGTLDLAGSLEATTLTISSGTTIGGDGTLTGDLVLDAGALFAFDINDTLEVSGSVTLDSLFGADDLVGLDSSIDLGTYTLISGTSTDFSSLGIENFGLANAFDLGGGKSAYFSNGSLELTVVPEPSTALLLTLAGGLLVFLKRRR